MAAGCMRYSRHLFISAFLRATLNKNTEAKFRSLSLHKKPSGSSVGCGGIIIDGKSVANEIKSEIKLEVDQMVCSGRRAPHLSVILVGDDPASATYVRNKIRASNHTGIGSELYELPSSVSESHVLDMVQSLNINPDVDGILVQLPVPPHMSERKICNAISPSKDVDGFHVINVGRCALDMRGFLPATPAGVMELLRRYNIDTFGKHAVVCGRSKNVGLPIALLLHADGIGETHAGDATVTICHRYTPPEDLVRITRSADILVVATGVPGLIQPDMVREGVVVIDVGINRVTDPDTGKQKLVGDVNYNGVREKASYITPVPGGVGPMTVAMLLKNTLQAANNNYTTTVNNAGRPPRGHAHDRQPDLILS